MVQAITETNISDNTKILTSTQYKEGLKISNMYYSIK